MVTADLFTVDVPALEQYFLARGRPDNAYSLARVAAEAWWAAQADPLQAADETAIQQLLDAEGGRIRSAVRAVLSRNPRFRHFRDTTGELYCLSDLLPDIETPMLAQIWEILNKQDHEQTLRGLESDDLLQWVWGWTDDGSDAYQLLRFALNVTLQGFQELRYIAGTGWVLEAAWRRLAERPSFSGLSAAGVGLDGEATEGTTARSGEAPTLYGAIPGGTIPDGTLPVDGLEDEQTIVLPRTKQRSSKRRRRKRGERRPPADADSWRQGRQLEVSFALEAEHYYDHWLPLVGEMQWLFPPWPSQVTLHCDLDGRRTRLNAWVAPEIGRILAGRDLYDALYKAGVFPGARLQITAREGDYEYELRPLPAPAGQNVMVYLLALDGEGRLVTSAELEALPYAVDGKGGIVVAAAPYEALPALWQQVEIAAKPLFARMVGICQHWQSSQKGQRGHDSPLVFAVDDLLSMLELDALPPDEALVEWVLWRYKAFERQADGKKARFWPEQGDFQRAFQSELPRRPGRKGAGTSGRRVSLVQLLQVGLPIDGKVVEPDQPDQIEEQDGLRLAETAEPPAVEPSMVTTSTEVISAQDGTPPEEPPPVDHSPELGSQETIPQETESEETFPQETLPQEAISPTVAFSDLPLSEQATIPMERPQRLSEMEPTIVWKPQEPRNLLWSVVMEDSGRREVLLAAAAAYLAHPLRQIGCFLRQTALARVRALLAPEKLPGLTLANFNNVVWQMGAVRYRGRRARIDSEQFDQLLAGLSMADVRMALQRGDLFLDGNQTWGGAMLPYGVSLSLSNADKTRLLRHVLSDLLYGNQPDEVRINHALAANNGLRMDSITGILHAVYPERHIPYHVGAVKLLQDLGVPWPLQWDKNAATYRTYYDFALMLRDELGFTDLTDVDWFVMRWDKPFTDPAPSPAFHSPRPEANQPAVQSPPPPPPQTQRPATEPRAKTAQPPAAAADEFAPIRRLLQQQLVDRVVWTAAGERAYVAAAGENGITVISGRREYHLRWNVLQRVYQALQQRKALVIAEVRQIVAQSIGPRGVEQTEVVMGILALLEHVAAETIPPRLRYRQAPEPEAIRLKNPRNSPYAAGDSAVRQR